MSDLASRLVWARETAGFETAVEGAARLGVPYNTYVQHENGIRGFRADRAAMYAKAYRVDVEWLLFGKGEARPRQRSIMIIGKVAAGAEGFYDDDFPMGGGDPLPELEPSEHIAVTVEGDSMVPRFYPGETLIFGPARDPYSLIGRECMVKLRDKRKLVKVLRRGSAPGFWDLHSVNTSYAPMEDVEIYHALPLVGLRV